MADLMIFILIIITFCMGIVIARKKGHKLIAEIIKSTMCFFLFFFSGTFTIIPRAILHIEKTKTNSIYLNAFANICLLIIFILLYRKELIKEYKKFTKNFKENIDTGFKYWILGLIVMMSTNIIINMFITNNQATNEQLVQNMITKLPIIMVINAGVIGPFIEEITFRKCFKNVFDNKWAFIIISSLVFGSLHVVPGIIDGANIKELFYIIPYASLGFSLAYMYYETDTVFTSYTMHALHNTILIIMAILK